MREEDFKTLTASVTTELPAVLCPTLQFFSHYAEPRTLLYGYDCDRNTHHLYSDDNGNVILHVYSTTFGEGPGDEEYHTKELINFTETGIVDLEVLIPNKRLYPQYCDFDACATLKQKGVNLPFTSYVESRKDGPYYGVKGVF